MKLFVIGSPLAAESVARELAQLLGVEAKDLEGLYEGRTAEEGDAALAEAISDPDWVVYGSEFSNREKVMRASELIAVADLCTAVALWRLLRIKGEGRGEQGRLWRLFRSKDTRSKLNIRLVAFSYKVRRVKGGPSLRRLRREIERRGSGRG